MLVVLYFLVLTFAFLRFSAPHYLALFTLCLCPPPPFKHKTPERLTPTPFWPLLLHVLSQFTLAESVFVYIWLICFRSDGFQLNA